MDKRQLELIELQNFTKSVDTKISKILENLQWDKKTLMQSPNFVVCKYDKHHTIPMETAEAHEMKCFYKYHGYSIDDQFLPDFDGNAYNAVNLSEQDIAKIIHEASTKDSSFKKVVYLYPEFEQCLGTPCKGPQPMTLARLQCTYTPDERRAIHDAVVKVFPTTSNPLHINVLNADGSQTNIERKKSQLELEAELRDMRRRRVRYRGNCSDKNYSNVLRGLIETQMETLSSVIEKRDHDDNYKRETKDSSDSPQNEKPNMKRDRNNDHKLSDYSSNKSKYSNRSTDFNSSYKKDKKNKHKRSYEHREERDSRDRYFRDDIYKHRHTHRAEKYDSESSKAPRSPKYSSNRYNEDETKYSSYDKRRSGKSTEEKKKHKERDSKHYERKSHHYSDTSRDRRK